MVPYLGVHVLTSRFMRAIDSFPFYSQEVTEEKLIEYTDTLLQIFDNNKDGKLQLSEMAQ